MRAAIRSLTVTAVVVAAIPLGGPASAGGGCHRGMTEGKGDTVAMKDACFTPSVLRVEPGTEVTFVNQDPIAHNVSANGWGYYEDMAVGDRFRATFEKPGVYPFACTYHPGMTGAIVVGDGTGAGPGETVAAGSFEAALDQDAGETGPVATSTSDDASAGGWVAAGAAGLLVGGVVGLGVRRRRA